MASDAGCSKTTMTQPAAPSASEMAEKQWQCTLDPDILECPICLEPFSPPVYQCKNGHTLCSACYEKIAMSRSSKCPSCSQPIGRIRNLAMEQIIDTLQVKCKHPGCDKMVKYTERKQHEDALCDYYPIRCPVPIYWHCQHTGPKKTIPLHIMENHKLMEILNCPGSSTSVTFKLKLSEHFSIWKLLMCDRAWLMLNCFSGDQGHCHTYCCAACGVSKEVAYKLTVEILVPSTLHRRGTKTPLVITKDERLYVYSMQTVARQLQGDNWDGFLNIPRKAAESTVTLSLL